MIISTAKVLADVTRTGKDRRAIFVQFAAADISAQLDLLQQQQLYQFGQLRSIFIDTSSQPTGSNGCRIETDSGQTIVAAPGTQGYYTVFVPFVSKLIISSNAGVNLILFDRDVAPQVWSSQASSGSIPNPLPVQIDGQPIATSATLQNWLTNFPVSQNSVWNVGVNNFPKATTLIGSGAAGVGNRIIVPSSTAVNLKFFQFSSNDAVTSASDCLVQFFDGAGNLLIQRDLAASTSFSFITFWAINFSLDIIGLNYTLSNSLASGGVSYVVAY